MHGNILCPKRTPLNCLPAHAAALLRSLCVLGVVLLAVPVTTTAARAQCGPQLLGGYPFDAWAVPPSSYPFSGPLTFSPARITVGTGAGNEALWTCSTTLEVKFIASPAGAASQLLVGGTLLIDGVPVHTWDPMAETTPGGGYIETAFVTVPAHYGYNLIQFEPKVIIVQTIQPPGLANVRWSLGLIFKVTQDLACQSADKDGDGICDEWEVLGIPYVGPGTGVLRYPLPGANPKRKDVYVEVDSMVGCGPPAFASEDVTAAILAAGLVPTETVLDRVVKAFLDAPVPPPVGVTDGIGGVALHVIMDEQLPFLRYFARDELDEMHAIKHGENGSAGYFGTELERSDLNVWKASTGGAVAKGKVYHYCVFGDRFITRLGIMGMAEPDGDDFTVLAHHRRWNEAPPAEYALQQAATFMHELGHNLGLRHGGADTLNFKPNYVSVMNYMWEWRGMGAGPWTLDYSRQRLPDLDENALHECQGFSPDCPADLSQDPYPGILTNYTTNQTGAQCVPLDSPSALCSRRTGFDGWIDWNNNGQMDALPVAVDINAFGQGASNWDVLAGHDDWKAIKYNFRGSDGYRDLLDAGDFPEEIPMDLLYDLRLKLNADDCQGGIAGVAFPAVHVVCPGNSAQVSVTATGCAPFTFRWRRADHTQSPPWTDLTDGAMPGGTVVSGSHGPVLTLSNLAPDDFDGPDVYCVVGDASNQFVPTDSVALVIGPPVFTTHPLFHTPPSCTTTSDVVIFAEATGSGSVSYAWQKDGVPLVESADVLGVHTGTLTIVQADTSDNGVYNCVAAGACGATTSDGIEVLANGAGVVILEQPVGHAFCPNQFELGLSTVVSGTGTLYYHWHKDGTPLENNGRIFGARSSMLYIYPADPGDLGTYECFIANQCGTASTQPVVIDAYTGTAPTVIQHPSPARACPGGTAAFTMVGSASGTFSYEWQFRYDPANPGDVASIEDGPLALIDGTVVADVTGTRTGTLTVTLRPALRTGVLEFKGFVLNDCEVAEANIARLTICAADFNCVNNVTVQDIFDFLAAWFAQSPAADFNGMNGVTVQDIFDFLAAWFVGC